jgi:predicted 3-demethylubiquinone-9 3-methyltransferase (glyoxalase superfamily)/uncharacterized protein (UPF0262 family)
MASLHFEVDTTPMARSVDTVGGHIANTTAAVVAMEAAVIAAERQSAETICDNVDNGFYVMMKSQISQKAVVAYNEMISKQIALVQLVKALENVRRQMEADYNMICKRYAKLFASLNKALETRIREIDKAAMKLAEIRSTVIYDRLKNESSLLLSSSEEALALKEQALAGKLKRKTQETLSALSGSVTEKQFYNQQLESILVLQENNDNNFLYLPAVLFSSMSFLNEQDEIESIYTAQNNNGQAAPVVQAISAVSGDYSWQTVDGEKKKLLRNEFISLCEKETDPRVSEKILSLFEEKDWEEAHI